MRTNAGVSQSLEIVKAKLNSASIRPKAFQDNGSTMTRDQDGNLILRKYRFGPYLIEVGTDEPDASRWLEEFLTPWFRTDNSGPSDFIVNLTCSASLFTSFTKRKDEKLSRTFPCFALDSQIVELPGWEEDGVIVVSDAERGCFYMVGQGRVDIIAKPGVRRIRVGLMRVVRELAVLSMAKKDVLDLHAAAFAVGEQAIVLVGPKQSGKTDFLLTMLASGKANLISNDRVLVHLEDGSEYTYGIPTLVSIRDDTLLRFPRLRYGSSRLQALFHSAESKLIDIVSPEDRAPPHGFSLNLSQIAERLDASIVRGALIAAIVFPEISLTTESWFLEPVDPHSGVSQLQKCLYGVQSGWRSPTIFENLIVSSRGGGHKEQEAIVHRLAPRIPLFRGSLGRDTRGESAGAWLEALNEALLRGHGNNDE